MLRKDYDQFLVVDEDSEEGFFIRAERWRIYSDPKKESVEGGAFTSLAAELH